LHGLAASCYRPRVDTTTEKSATDRAAGPVQTYVTILCGGRSEVHAVASRDPILGRSERADVAIDEPSISRQHAVVHLGPPMTIEDLASANGVTVRGQRIEPNTPVPLALDEVAMLGSIMVFVQQRRAPVGPQRVRRPDDFRRRLADECARGDKRRFAVLLVEAATDLAAAVVRHAIEDLLRPVDLVGSYGPRAFAILLSDATAADAGWLRRQLAGALGRRDVDASIGVAHFPADGCAAEPLIARAAARARGEADEDGGAGVVVLDPAMTALFAHGEQVAAGDLNVLILGETGAGKQVLAEHIRRRSTRAGRPFVRLNCAAIGERMLERELFGFEKGAFDGAHESKPGLIETADGGTVLLDEIGDTPPAVQLALLRAIEERSVLRVGGLAPRPVDVRFLAATHRALDLDVEAGRFRQDLYFRIACVTLTIPPLRERAGEIVPLASSFAARAAHQLGRRPPDLTAATRGILEAYRWPGNVRELRSVVEHAVLLAGDAAIDARHLPVERMTSVGPPSPPSPLDVRSGPRDRIVEALARHGGNQTEAAKELGVSRRTLGTWMKNRGIPRPRRPT
jgi:DNA-binding NtrC family response regulator